MKNLLIKYSSQLYENCAGEVDDFDLPERLKFDIQRKNFKENLYEVHQPFKKRIADIEKYLAEKMRLFVPVVSETYVEVLKDIQSLDLKEVEKGFEVKQKIVSKVLLTSYKALLKEIGELSIEDKTIGEQAKKYFEILENGAAKLQDFIDIHQWLLKLKSQFAETEEFKKTFQKIEILYKDKKNELAFKNIETAIQENAVFSSIKKIIQDVDNDIIMLNEKSVSPTEFSKIYNKLMGFKNLLVHINTKEFEENNKEFIKKFKEICEKLDKLHTKKESQKFFKDLNIVLDDVRDLDECMDLLNKAEKSRLENVLVWLKHSLNTSESDPIKLQELQIACEEEMNNILVNIDANKEKCLQYMNFFSTFTGTWPQQLEQVRLTLYYLNESLASKDEEKRDWKIVNPLLDNGKVTQKKIFDCYLSKFKNYLNDDKLSEARMYYAELKIFLKDKDYKNWTAEFDNFKKPNIYFVQQSFTSAIESCKNTTDLRKTEAQNLLKDYKNEITELLKWNPSLAAKKTVTTLMEEILKLQKEGIIVLYKYLYDEIYSSLKGYVDEEKIKEFEKNYLDYKNEEFRKAENKLGTYTFLDEDSNNNNNIIEINPNNQVLNLNNNKKKSN